MKYHTFVTTASLLLQFVPVIAHGDESHHAIQKRDEFINQRSLSACRDNAKAKALFERSYKRREDLINHVRHKRGLEQRSLEHSHRITKRDFDSVAGTDHNSTFADAQYNVDSSVLFSGNTSCLLMPEVTEGPYFVSGEYVRPDITDGQAGLELYLDIQVIDVNTCEPVSSAFFDAWHANATGVYSGVVASGNGDGADDPTNINNTFCRGVQFTDADGVIKFKTIFPGHYGGRSTHIHIMSHKGGTIHPNGTYSGDGRVTHVGQLFFDEDLRSAVESLEPYASNNQRVTTNSQDSIARQSSENDYDPFMKYAYLGDTVTEGLLAWITVGVDPEAEYDPSVAVALTEEGGVNEGSRGIVGTGEEVDAVPSGQPEEPPAPGETGSQQSGTETTGGSAETPTTSTTGGSSSTPGSGSRNLPSLEYILAAAAGGLLGML